MLKFHPLQLIDRSALAEDAVSLSFAVPDTLREAFRFEAGQHLAIRADINGAEIRRTYSIVSTPTAKDLRIGVRVHARGSMSNYLATQASVGDRLEVLTPNGSFHAPAGASGPRTFLAFAAGSGITPVLSIMATMLAAHPQNRMLLILGNRSAARAMFLEEVLALKNRYLSRLAVHFVMSEEAQDIELFNGRIDAAKVRDMAGRVFDPAAIDEFFVCGPGTMIAEISELLLSRGIPSQRIHSEYFSVTAPAAVAAQEIAGAPLRRSGTTQVTVVMDGRRRAFTMPREGESILEAATRAGIELPYSCCAGICSTCRTKVVRGTAAMAENYALEDWEIAAGYTLCCQSRPTSPEIEISFDER
jgi:ring-1,2-phenylacetyl-CoA epoxidase subunit PaaE